jgi:uncharacterized membrane protein
MNSTLGRLLADRPHQALSRAVVKTVLYRAVMVCITVLVAYVVVGDVSSALSIGFVANVVKTGTYYGYERLWDRIAWGVPETG